jgi:predicted phosphoadenosine phosphosulfate sulfurtransferase
VFEKLLTLRDGVPTKIEVEQFKMVSLPDEAPIELEQNDLVPSYRRICKAILKNDLALLSLGFNKTYCKTYSMLKRIEIEQRIIKNKQLKLNL